MTAKKLILTVFLGLMVVYLSGCIVAAVGVGAAAAAGVGYVKGDLQAVLDEDIDRVYHASINALEELELPITGRDKTALDAKLISRNSSDKKIQIKLKRTEENYTEISIRIGTFGDEAQSRSIYDKIKSHL
jgi:hypothetical protein